MAGFKINTGIIRLQVECDGREEVIAFNPDDVNFVNNFCRLLAEMEAKQEEYKTKMDELEQNTEVDAHGIPKNMGDKLQAVLEVCMFMREQVDAVFGAGTCQKVFGDVNTLDMFTQFFDGITPYIQKNREEKMAKYTASKFNGVM